MSYLIPMPGTSPNYIAIVEPFSTLVVAVLVVRKYVHTLFFLSIFTYGSRRQLNEFQEREYFDDWRENNEKSMNNVI